MKNRPFASRKKYRFFKKRKEHINLLKSLSLLNLREQLFPAQLVPFVTNLHLGKERDLLKKCHNST